MDEAPERAPRPLEETGQRRRSTGDMRMHRAARARPVPRRSVDTGALSRDSGIAMGHTLVLPLASGSNTSGDQIQRIGFASPAFIQDPSPAQDLPVAGVPPIPVTPFQAPSTAQAPALNERRVQPRARRRYPVRSGNRSGIMWKMLGFIGYGNGDRYRKELFKTIASLTYAFIQLTVTLALVIFASIHRSPRDRSISEWKACDKPLGAWALIWIIKLLYDSYMIYWGWTREWKGRRHELRSRSEVAERAQADRGQSNTGNLRPLGDLEEFAADGGADEEQRVMSRTLPHSKLYSRLSLFLSLVVIAWFLTSNVLLYTSVHTCRATAPHLWWLIFAMLCTQYLIIIQVLVIALLVFIIGPLIYLFWNIVLMCLGRHPLQNPHYINPEIRGLSKSIVEQIPLVMYIPSPPEGEGEKGANGKDLVTKPEPVYSPGSGEHTYPPKPPLPKRRFTFIRRKTSKSLSGMDGKQTVDGEKGDSEGQTWEDCWERNELPFVRLDENRASCAICLLDFEEPKRRVASEVIKSWARPKAKDADAVVSDRKDAQPDATNGNADENGDTNASSLPNSPGEDREGGRNTTDGNATEGDIQEVPASPSHNDRRHSLRLEDAGEGAQPLRLLECGHVFHKTCVDPWLIDVSGRCPTCQRPVTITQTKTRKRAR